MGATSAIVAAVFGIALGAPTLRLRGDYLALVTLGFGEIVPTVFVNLEGWPDDWQTNLTAVIKFFRDHQCPSFLEYGEYPYVTADEIKKALRLKAAFSNMLDQMQ